MPSTEIEENTPSKTFSPREIIPQQINFANQNGTRIPKLKIKPKYLCDKHNRTF